MTELSILALIARWIHIISASLAIGVPIFLRFVFLPVASATLPAESMAQLRLAIHARWFKWINILIPLFIASGLYTFITVVLPLNLGEYKAAYHMIFGFKMILALGIFFLASALMGKAKAFEIIRIKAKTFSLILVAMLIILVILSGVLRSIRDQAIKLSAKPTVEMVVPPPTR